MELWKDAEYVELAESTIKKIRDAVNKGEVLPKYGSRAIRLLETQDDYSFVNDMVKHAENGSNLTNAIYRRGEKLIKELKPIPYAEGHHEASVGTHGRLKNYSFKKTLQINAINASRGSYVGTSFKNLSFLSRYVHSGDEAIAHINPWAPVHLLKDGSFEKFAGKTTDTGIWATKEKPFLNRELPPNWEETFGTTNKKHARLLLRARKEFVGGQKRYTAFNRNLDPFTAARRLTDESLDPQRMLTRAAFNDPTEVLARKAIKDILGTDVFAIRDPKRIQEIYKVTSAAGINMNEMYELAKEGKLDDIDFKQTNPGNIKNLISDAKKGIKIKPPSLSGLAKQFTKANILNVVTGAASFADIGIPDKEVADELRKEDKSKGWEMYQQQLKASALTVGLLRTASMIPQVASGLSNLGPAASHPLTWIVGGGVALNRLDENVFEGKGKQLLKDVAPDPIPFYNKKGKEEFEKNKEEDPLGSFAMPF